MEVCNVNKKLKKLVNVLLIVAFIAAMTGCTTTQKPLPQQQGIPETTQQPYQNQDFVNMPTPEMFPYTVNEGSQVALDTTTSGENIAKQLRAMEPIEDANCVISGDTALVGIDIKDNFYKYDEGEYLKDDIKKKVMNMAPGIKNVAVTEEPDLYNRINKLSRDLKNGRTMQGMATEFSNIINRILPDRNR